MPGSILGTVVTRVEDPDLLTGRAAFVDDLPLPGALHLVFVRSPFAHARLGAVDVSEAASAPGVVGVFTAADLELKPYEGLMVLNPACARPPLADDKVRFVGDAVAAVVAETRVAAVDAAELVVVDYDALPAAVDMEAALAPDAPLPVRRGRIRISRPESRRDVRRRLWPAPRSWCGPASRTSASRSCRWRAPRSRSSPATSTVTVWVSDPDAARLSQRAWRPRSTSPRSRCGSSRRTSAARSAASRGSRPSTCVVIACARRLGRPVKWVETRSENLVAMPHGRGQVQYVELGLSPRRQDHRDALSHRRRRRRVRGVRRLRWRWDRRA